MILAFVFAIIAIIAAFLYTDYDYGFLDAGEVIKNLLVFAVLFGFIYGIMWLLLGCASINTGETSEEVLYKIEGLQNNVETEQYINGTFLLGCGGVSGGTNTSMKYYYFKCNEYGKALETLNAAEGNVYLRETDEQEPCLIQVYETYKSNSWYNFFFKEFESKRPKCRILVVPTNTVKIDYNVNI